MDPSALVVGHTYYLVTFADSQQTMPGIEPRVYIGVDVFGPQPDGAASKYYFQDTPSFAMFGLATEENPPVKFEGEGGVEKPQYWVTHHEAREIGWTIVDLPAALQEVRQAKERAEQLCHPVLQVARGKWHRVPTAPATAMFREALNLACGEINEAARFSDAIFKGEELDQVRRELARLLEQIESGILVRVRE
jgi:hypothetical protein